jgi:hypothetical protein
MKNKTLPLCPTKSEKIAFNAVEPGWLELAYISPDWRVWKNHDLQNLCVKTAAEILMIPKDQIRDSFYWAEDEPTNHKQLFVKLDMIPNDMGDDAISFITNYMHGFMDAVGYM